MYCVLDELFRVLSLPKEEVQEKLLVGSDGKFYPDPAFRDDSVQESSEGDGWEQTAEKYVLEEIEDAHFNRTWLFAHLRRLVPGLLSEARTLALQEAAALVKGKIKKVGRIVDGVSIAKIGENKVHNEALEDAAREIESKIV